MTVLSKFAAAVSDIRLEYAPYYLAGVVALLILKLVLGAAYNVFLHPLRKFPGPKLAIATDFYYKYKVIRGDEVPWLIECHEKYGEVVRMGPDRLSYITSQAWKDIFGHRTGGRLEFGKDPGFISKAINGADSIVSEPTPEGHGQVRRIFTNAFSDKALKLQEPLIRLHVDKLKRNIDKAIAADPEVHLDAVKLYNSTTFDIMGDLSFGEPLGMLDTGEYTPWVKTVFESIRVGSCLRFLNKHPLLRRFMKALLPPSLKRKEEEHFQHSVDRVDKRLSKGLDIGKSDIWKLVLENKKANLPLPKMHANASVFMIAGTETTATTLSGLTYLLLRNPDKMKKLVAEIRTLREEELTLENLPRLEYLLACLSETLRCYPPVPVANPRVVPKGGAKVAGEWLPENTSLGVTQKAAYSSSLNFKDAKEFVPERWLPGTGYDTDNKDVFKPFSFGPRNCIGMNLAYHEMRIIAALVLWHYDIELCPESENWMEQKTYILWDKPELMVKFRPARK